MTIITNPITPVVLNQPISPFFGVQSGGSVPATQNPLVAIPSTMTQLEALSRGIVPANANVASVNGLSTGAGDPCSMLELLSDGNGVPAMRGTAVAPSGGMNDEQFAAGTAAPTFQENGPTPTNTEPQPLGPVSGAVTGANLTLSANTFNG